jgi:hypothetical protein
LKFRINVPVAAQGYCPLTVAIKQHNESGI